MDLIKGQHLPVEARGLLWCQENRDVTLNAGAVLGIRTWRRSHTPRRLLFSSYTSAVTKAAALKTEVTSEKYLSKLERDSWRGIKDNKTLAALARYASLPLPFILLFFFPPSLFTCIELIHLEFTSPCQHQESEEWNGKQGIRWHGE